MLLSAGIKGMTTCVSVLMVLIYLESFEQYIKENSNKIAALHLICTRPADLDRQSLRDLKLRLDQEGFNSRLLNTAWKDAKNETIVADIISYIRTLAIGTDLVGKEDRVKRAMETVRKMQNWNKVQNRWLNRFEKQLLAELVL